MGREDLPVQRRFGFYTDRRRRNRGAVQNEVGLVQLYSEALRGP
jgi:hypothetical protein